MDFRVSRGARDQYGFDEALFSSRGDAVFISPAAARRFAQRMVAAGGARPDRPVNAGDIDAMGLIHEIQHRAISRSAARMGDRPLNEVLRLLDAELGSDRVDATLAAVEDGFPSPDVYGGSIAGRDHLEGTTDGIPNREVDLEELLLLWVANQNAAFMIYVELFDDARIAGATDYDTIVEAWRRASARRAAAHPRGEDLVERLLTPGRVAPRSLRAQLRWILDEWGDIVGDDLRGRLTISLDVLAEEELAARRPGRRTARAAVAADAAALHGFARSTSTQRFSPDRDWMPNVVLLAKSTYVWLDQLSRRYRRPIWTLDAIPDEELDRCATRGITGLWLIGLWERSRASQRIKQLRGNTEAVASAYSLLDYRIAEDLGGEARLCQPPRSGVGARHPARQRHGAEPHGHRLPLGHRAPRLVRPALGAAVSRLLVQRPEPLVGRARRHLHRGPLLRQLRRGRGLQAAWTAGAGRSASSTTATTARRSRGTTRPSSTT